MCVCARGSPPLNRLKLVVVIYFCFVCFFSIHSSLFLIIITCKLEVSLEESYHLTKLEDFASSVALIKRFMSETNKK